MDDGEESTDIEKASFSPGKYLFKKAVDMVAQLVAGATDRWVLISGIVGFVAIFGLWLNYLPPESVTPELLPDTLKAFGGFISASWFTVLGYLVAAAVGITAWFLVHGERAKRKELEGVARTLRNKLDPTRVRVDELPTAQDHNRKMAAEFATTSEEEGEAE